jgi:chemotaxis protein methyltransferase CheR
VLDTATWAGDADIRLGDLELTRIIRLVYARSGITLHEGKRALVEARLRKRLRALGCATFAEYLRYVESDATGQELSGLLDAIATKHTSFFREEQHFQFLETRVLPELRTRAGSIRVWSAACATGEEPVTLAMTLLEALPPVDHARLRLMASDLSRNALAIARAGVYRLERVTTVPRPLLRKYFERGLGAQAGLARVSAGLRNVIDYRQLNLLEIASLGEQFDVIFCRNVLIYFDRAVQQRVISMLERHLAPGGYLFIAHSESLNTLDHGLRWVAPAIYQQVRA